MKNMNIFSSVSRYLSRNVRKPTMWILTRSDTNQTVQPLEMARGLKFCMKEVEVLYLPCSENKGMISFAFAYAKRWFSHEAAQFLLRDLSIPSTPIHMYLFNYEKNMNIFSSVQDVYNNI